MLRNNLEIWNEDNTKRLHEEWFSFPEKLDELTPFQFVATTATAESYLMCQKIKEEIEKQNTEAKVITLAFMQLFPIDLTKLGKKFPELNAIDLVYAHKDIIKKLLGEQMVTKCFFSESGVFKELEGFRVFGDGMNSFDYEQFAITDNLFQIYMMKGEVKTLNQFIGHCIVEKGQVFNGKKADEYEKIAEKLNNIQKKALVRNYHFLRQYLRKLYPKAFESKPNQTGEHSVVEHTKKDTEKLMDWLNLQLSIAESGIFGKFQDVNRVNINYVLKFLHEQKIKAEEMESKLESKN